MSTARRDIALSVEHVYKKFRKGENYNSLRDVIPALTRKVFARKGDTRTRQREFLALNDISFDVRRGEAFGIIGPNGAGKSTMLKLLSRVMQPTSGRIEVDGRISGLIELGAGFHQDLTGRENVYLYGSILGMRRVDLEKKMDEIVDFAGLEEFIDTPIKRYSSGMYARLGFSVAAHVDPDVLLVDEVLSVGDYVFQRKCLEYMKKCIDAGATVVFVSHDLKTIAEFCQRCLLLDRGAPVVLDSVEQVVGGYIDRLRAKRSDSTVTRDVSIVNMKIRNGEGEADRFQSGEKAWVDVELLAHNRCSKLSVSLYITDERQRNIFDTSTQRLGYSPFDLQAGDVVKCTFEVQLNMVAGLFHPCILLYRYDTEVEYDRWAPATTIYVGSDQDVRGTVNCFPELVRQEVCPSQAVLQSTSLQQESCAAATCLPSD